MRPSTMQPIHVLTLIAIGAGTALSKHTHSRPANLFVTSYSGTLTTLQLSKTGQNASYALNNVSVDLGCNPSPSSLTLDKPNDTLFCVGEAAAGGPGSLTAYNIQNGTLALRSTLMTAPGPVWGGLYGGDAGTKAIALSQYGAGGVAPYSISSNLTLHAITPNVTFPAPKPPGPVTESQSASHPHTVMLDPTGKYLVANDLGADLVHVFSFDAATGALKEANPPLSMKPGTGPRFAAFSVKGNDTFMYLVSELSAQLFGFKVTYPPTGGLSFQQLFATDTVGGQKVPQKVAPAEVRIAPDNKYLIVANRNDTAFSLPNPDPKNSTAIPSDSLAVYSLAANGSATFLQLWPAGGSYARSISMNRKGNLLAVGLQQDGRIAVLRRDVKTGLLGRPVAWYQNAGVGQVTSVKWGNAAANDDGLLGMDEGC